MLRRRNRPSWRHSTECLHQTCRYFSYEKQRTSKLDQRRRLARTAPPSLGCAPTHRLRGRTAEAIGRASTRHSRSLAVAGRSSGNWPSLGTLSRGEVSEWLMVPFSKSGVAQVTGSSNLPLSAIYLPESWRTPRDTRQTASNSYPVLVLLLESPHRADAYAAHTGGIPCPTSQDEPH